jgi:hypothetical protein
MVITVAFEKKFLHVGYPSNSVLELSHFDLGRKSDDEAAHRIAPPMARDGWAIIRYKRASESRGLFVASRSSSCERQFKRLGAQRTMRHSS